MAEISKGAKIRNNFESEKNAVKFARRSIVSKKKIPKNTIISIDMLDIKRPGTGIKPKNLERIIGSITKNEIEEDTPIQWDDLNNGKKINQI